MQSDHTDVAIIGAGSIGIAVAYYIKQQQPGLDVTLIDSEQPMSLTSAASGENYRNWWPHPIMKQFMDRSIDLLDQLDGQCNNEIVATRNGYVLASRNAEPHDLLDNLNSTFTPTDSVRSHTSATSYTKSLSTNTNGVELLQSDKLVQQCFPGFDTELKTIVHIRRGGCISAYSLGSYMLTQFKGRGGRLVKGNVEQIDHQHSDYALATDDGKKIIASSIVNAAGPYAQQLSTQLGITLPVTNIYQQKISFADKLHTVSRTQPFTIDLDPQLIDWTDDERYAISEDPALARFAEEMPGSIHCRPDGGQNSNRIKLGWAYNITPASSIEHAQEILHSHFPEIVLRGAARLNPLLKQYYDGFPRDFTHYGGYYTMTNENWPLIGDTPLPGYYIATAMSGFGSMAACATGELAALYITGGTLPDYAHALSLKRSSDTVLMREIDDLGSKGIL